MSKIEEAERLWTRESILQAENAVLQQVLSARSSEAAEASVSYARFLRLSGLDPENYALCLKILEVENHWVLDALIGGGDPFLLLSTIQPNQYLISKCFILLTRWRLEGLRWDANMEQVARQAMRIRSNFFDNTRVLEDCIPQVLLVPGDYRKDEFPPRFVFAD